MQQFAFTATDTLGNSVGGAVFANDMVSATEQIREMGYQPVRVELTQMTTPAPPIPAPFTSATPTETVETQYDLNLVPKRTLLGGDVVETHEQRHEPWERGGAIPQESLYDKPVVKMNAEGIVIRPLPTPLAVNAQAGGQTVSATTGGISERGHVARVPLGARGEPAKSAGQLFKETFLYPIISGVVLKDLVQFYRQFATLINAGLTIHQSLSSLEATTQNPKLQEIARAGMKQVQQGGRFSEVMAQYPWIFNSLQLEMIRAAEEGGMLDQVLRHIADYVEHELEMRRMISRETFYPKVVLFFALMIMGRTGLTGGALAVVGLVVGEAGGAGGVGYLANTVGFGGAILLTIFAAVAIYRLFFFNAVAVRETVDRIKISLPVVGKITRQFALARFARSFAALYRGGFTMSRALEIAGSSSGNAVVQKVVHEAIPAAQHGMLVSDKLRASGLFPPMIIDMFHTGEMTGGLDTMMDKSADYFEEEAKLKSHQAAIVFGVIIFFIVAILVGNAVISGYVGLAGKSTTVPEGP